MPPVISRRALFALVASAFFASTSTLACTNPNEAGYVVVNCEFNEDVYIPPGFTSEQDVLSYFEVRAPSAVGALVLANGTRIAFDFAAGNMTITAAGSAPQVVEVSALSEAERQDFWRLAAAIAADPEFSFESGKGAAPAAGAVPSIIGDKRYPLLMSDFGLPRAVAKDDWSRSSPCTDPARCRPTQTLPRITVTAVLANPQFTFSGGGGWFRATNPSPIGSCPADPKLCDWIDRSQWERWRQGRCDALTGHLVVGTAAALSAAATCFTPVVATGVGTIACAGSAIAYAWSLYEAYSAKRDCNAPYGGVGTWP